jgi:uncharacterized protein
VACSEAGTCLLCRRPNACGMAAGHATCWCSNASVDGELVAWLAARGLDKICLCRRCATGDLASPCVKTCVVDAGSATCRGCRRTLAEITDWLTMRPVERAAVLLRLAGITSAMPHGSRDAGRADCTMRPGP